MRRPPWTEEEQALFERLLASGDDAPSLEEKLAMVATLRRGLRNRGQVLDAFLIENATLLSRGVAEAAEMQRQLREILDKLIEPPWFPAVFGQLVQSTDGSPRAWVTQAGTPRVVGLAEGVEAASLAVGEEVFLAKEQNVIVERSGGDVPRFGETAVFERFTSDGRMVVKCRDEELVVVAAAELRGVELARGDQVRWNRSAWMAMEKIDRVQGRRFLLEDVPEIGRHEVGGQEQNLEALLSALTVTLVAPEKAALYGYGSRHSILLHGPPGCGKTLMVRAAAAEIRRLTGNRCQIAVVKPAEWESVYVSETERNIRDCFSALTEAAAHGFAILFLDEIETIGRIRGSAVGHHSDRFLGALLVELNGFVDRSGIAIIAATNRKDLVDPALLERLSDIEVVVKRPDMQAASEIFAIHLPESLPYGPKGSAAGDTRREIIDAAVSELYSPNAANDLCLLRFRDGRTRPVAARELASGRAFEQVCRAVRRSALLRDVRGGTTGVSRQDIDAAVAELLERLASTLTVHNVASYLSDLPQDVDVVSVEPIARKVARTDRYVNLH